MIVSGSVNISGRQVTSREIEYRHNYTYNVASTWFAVSDINEYSVAYSNISSNGNFIIANKSNIIRASNITYTGYVSTIQNIKIFGDFAYIIGRVQDSTTFFLDAFIQKYNLKTGTLVWEKYFSRGSSYNDDFLNMDLKNGQIVCVGRTDELPGVDPELLVVKLNDSDGTLISQHYYEGATSVDIVNNVYIHDNGDVYFSGTDTLTPVGTYIGFLSNDNSTSWLRKINDATSSVTSFTNIANTILVFNNKLYVAGRVSGASLQIGGSGTGDTFIAEFQLNGTFDTFKVVSLNNTGNELQRSFKILNNELCLMVSANALTHFITTTDNSNYNLYPLSTNNYEFTNDGKYVSGFITNGYAIRRLVSNLSDKNTVSSTLTSTVKSPTVTSPTYTLSNPGLLEVTRTPTFTNIASNFTYSYTVA